MEISSKLKHDFSNNAIRIDVLNKLIIEQFESKEDIDREYLQDLKKFLTEHLQYLDHFFLNQ